MKMHTLIRVILVFIVTELGIASPPTPTPTLVYFEQVIKSEGTVSISDGSSIFSFNKDGKFTQEPLGLSGMTVNGKWKVANNTIFTITGNWSWINGLSPESDYRKMIMFIYPGEFGSLDRFGEPVRIYRTYFIIDELIKMTRKCNEKAEQSAAPNSHSPGA
jgi:hypothetical protein